VEDAQRELADRHKRRALELRRLQRLGEAASELQSALRAQPNDPTTHFLLGSLALQRARLDEAVAYLLEAISLNPRYHQAYAVLSTAYCRLGRADPAVRAGSAAVRLKPDDPVARINVSNALRLARRFKEAATELDAALRLDPGNVKALNNYGNLMMTLHQPARAETFYRAALQSSGADVEVLSNLGNVLRKQAKIQDAISCYRRVLDIKPQAWPVHSNLLLALNSHPRADDGLLAEHVEWAHRHAAPLYPTTPLFRQRDRTPNRPLRIGYVSPDFRRHSVAYFFQNILAFHDREQADVFCYSNLARGDDVTEWLRGRAAHWRDIADWSDERVTAQVREDQVDVLVDLAGHTGGHRLLIFARRAAPVQATYLGYPNTTGLATMDYRITDAIADPPGLTESHYTERLMRLDGGFACYKPPETDIEPRSSAEGAAAPALFGSLNNLAKVTPEIIATWAAILEEVPKSRILLKADGLDDQGTRRTFIEMFERRGIESHRVQLQGYDPSLHAHLQTYHGIDVALDTFPYNGTTTTCEALWMGVPVITLAGRAHVSRVGASILERVGLKELAASNEAAYHAAAVDLGRNAAKRRELCASLRGRLIRSPLADAPPFVRGLELAYRSMWKLWCADDPAPA
jgi:predicted O-linked N-acetylglucosamine transferase (SPINDLY family)